jgi:hypothetical protein
VTAILKVEDQEFRPKLESLKRVIAEIPDAAAGMAMDTVRDAMGLGITAENQAGRGKQIADALKTIKDIKNRA